MSIKIASMNFGDCDTILHNTPNGMKNITEVLGPNGEVYWSAIKEITGIPPLSIRSNGTMLLDYLISGNMSQTSGVSPTTPIQPQECGNMSSNLVNISATTITGGTIYPITLSAGTYTASATLSSFNGTGGGRIRLQYSLNRTMNYSSNVKITTDGVSIATLEIPEGATSIAVYLQTYSGTVSYNASNIMLNTGSTAFPYEPYGYKIPISSNSTTTPIYLGEVPTTRKIKKLVLDGTEGWSVSGSGDAARFYINIADAVGSSSLYCTHFTNGIQTTSGNCEITASKNLVFNNSGIATTTANWKTWLSTQYAAGTPVTVWYVLAEPTTGIVNEPLRKIGDYADTVSYEQAGVQIPTNRGNTVIDVETTLKPSQMYIKYK